MGSRSFQQMQRRKVSGVILFLMGCWDIAMIGYDVGGDNILGRMSK